MFKTIRYTVILLDGDYAHLRDEQGEELLIARALLPDAIDEGSKLLFENFQYTIVQ